MSPPALIDSPATIEGALDTGELLTDILFSIDFIFDAMPRDESHDPTTAIAEINAAIAEIHSGVTFIPIG